MTQPRAILFDTFGTLVDWRSSLVAEFTAFGAERGIAADWTALVDSWRAAYAPSMDRVRRGELPWTTLDALHRASLDGLLAERGIGGFGEAERAHFTLGWHRLRAWPDSVAGLRRLHARFILGPLSNGNVSLLIDLARFNAFPFDMIFGSDVSGHFKPDPETYLGACRMLGLAPGEVMLAAAHNGDLAAARSHGMMTAFIARPTEYGPAQAKDLTATAAWDHVTISVEDLAGRLGV